MRIALVSRELYPYVGGGIAPIVAAAARLLASIAEVTVFTSAAHRREHERLRAERDPRLLPAEVRLVWVEEPGDEGYGAFYSHMHAYSAAVHVALRETYGDRGPDLIEFCDYLAEGFVTIQAAHTRAAWLERTLVCVRLHTSVEMCNVLDGHIRDDFPTRAVFDAERYCLRRADRVLWSGGDVLATYERFYGSEWLAPAARVPDAFFADHSGDPGRDGGPVAGEPVRMLYLGRLERRKGVQNLLRGLLRLERDDWRLTLLGGDTPTAPLQTSLRAQLELMVAGDERVVFADPVGRDDVPAFIRAHDLLVVPSLWECWPNTAREAFMCNRPVLGTPVGGLCEMVQDGRSGWLACGTSAAALADAVEWRLNDPEGITDLIASGTPRAVFEELCDPARLREQYKELLAMPRPRAKRLPRREPLVSIVVPYYQLERYVQETLDAVAAQTYPQIETLVVNDGSLREEDRVLEDVAAREGVTVLTQPNRGLGAARNFGISQARGAYVLPLDADDVIEPEFVTRCVEVMERDDELAYVTTWVQYMEEDGRRVVDERGGYMPYGNWSALVRRNNVAGTCTALLRRHLFDLGFRYSHDLTSYEDWWLYWELHEAGHFGAVIPERLFRYRVRARSMMREIGSPQLAQLHEEMQAHIREHELRWTADRQPPPVAAPAFAPSGAGDGAAPPSDDLAELTRTLDELRAVNWQLARGLLGKHDAAAASVLERTRNAERRVAELEDRLALEVQVAFRNYELFDGARKQLHTPRHRAVDAAREAVLSIPGVRPTARMTKRLRRS
jgi:glycogen synthase